MIIGVTGTLASGKDTVGSYLAEKRGFNLFSASDAIRAELKKQGIPESRDTLKGMGDQMREKFGPEYWIRLGVETIGKTKNLVIIPFFNPGEVEYLHQQGGILIAVDAPVKTRWERARLRGRITDEVTFEQFQKDEAVRTTSDKAGHQLERVISTADATVQNDGTEEELYQKVDEAIAHLGR